MRGGEKCLEILCGLYPDADLYTLVYAKGQLSEVIERMRIKTSFLQQFPGTSNYYRYYLPLFPTAIEQFNLKDYDLILSTSHCVAKGIVPMPESLHICYCFTPMRYIWDMYFEYFGETRLAFQKFIFSALSNYLRIWDVTSSRRVDFFVAISHHVERRIKKYYGRGSTVIYPPVDCSFFQPSKEPEKESDYFLMVTAMAPYKRVDLAVEAFNRSGKRLLIIGEGPGMKSLKKMAKTNIEFLGWLSNENVKSYYQGCRAFIFPGEEDFGMTPVEAQACGKPVIAYERGGVLESVIPFPQEKATGIFFSQPTAESLLQAIDLFERNRDRFDLKEIRDHALSFDRISFQKKMRSFIDEKYQAFCASEAKESRLA